MTTDEAAIEAMARLKLFAENPHEWRRIYNLAVSVDPCADLARDIRTALAALREMEGRDG